MKNLVKVRILVLVSSVLIFGLFTQCNKMEEMASESTLEFGGANSVVGGGNQSASQKEAIKNGFSNTVHTVLRNADYSCVGCHVKGGIGGQYPHADKDPEVAMNTIFNNDLVNVENPSASKLIDKVAIFNHNCAPNCDKIATDLTAMIGSWSEVIKANQAVANPGSGDDEEPVEVCVPEMITEEFVFGENNGGTGLTRRQAFDQEVFPVMLNSDCAGCHLSARQPLHSSNNASIAYAAWDNNNLADFNNVDNSDILIKVRNGHQGFNQNSDEFTDIRNAIIRWRDNIDETVGNNNGVTVEQREYDTCESYSEKIASINSVGGEPDQEEQVSGGNFAPSDATFQGTGLRVINNEYIGNPNTHGAYAVNSNNAGKAIFEFEVFEASDFEVLAEVWSTDGGTDSFFVSIADTPNPVEVESTQPNGYTRWLFGDTNEQYQAKTVENNGAKKVWTLNPGRYYLIFKERENFSRLRNIVVRKEGADAPISVNAYKTMRFDLSTALNKSGAELTFRLENFDDKSYKISEVRIKNAQYAYVKGLKILINDKFFPGNATYTLVDERVTSDDHQLSSSALVMLKVNGSGDVPKIDPAKMDQYQAALEDDNITDYSSYYLYSNGQVVYKDADELSLEFETLVMTDEK
ncbi:MAG: hypothetical protein VYA54_05775 [Bdellovibrionota bacterium]|nr:hypothetical protein [Bdellovibrionota bacterium]